MTQNHPKLKPELYTEPTSDPYYDGVPTYMTEVYDWAYVNPQKVRLLDRNWVVRVLLFFNDQRLMACYLNEIKAGMRVWQLAHVYGDLVSRAAKRVGEDGLLTDVTPAPTGAAERRYRGRK